MKSIVKILSVASAAFATQFAAAVPVVSSVDMNQSSKTVVITYTLSDEPAVVTLDVQTNANTSATAGDPGWTSIGGAAVCNAKGDVWKKVEAGNRTITWRPDQSWPDHVIAAGGARAVVTAWSLGNTPDYMVVDISATAAADSQVYYPSADFLPGGILGNPDYRTSRLVMRKIMAKDVTWMMGSTPTETARATNEDAHQVTLANNYYIGVFEVTQSQWGSVATNSTQKAKFTTEPSMRPMENVCLNEIRHTVNSQTANTAYDWPAAPSPVSFLGLLRAKTGIDFDLPSEAQWEFAARAGHGIGYWGDGSAIQNTDPDDNLNLLGRYQHNGGKIGANHSTTPANDCGVENGTAIVGTYAPNSWGIYDMHGNVWEVCLDFYVDDITKLGGAVNTESSAIRVRRGGGWNLSTTTCRSAYRAATGGATRGGENGFRLVCTAGLQ